MAHIVELDFGGLSWIIVPYTDEASGLCAHGACVHLKTITIKSRLAVIAHGGGQEVILNVRIFNARFGADETAGFKVIGGP